MTLNTKKVENQIWTDTLDLNLTSTAFYLMDKLGFSPRKTIQVLMNISELATSIRDNNVTLDELKEALEEEYRFRIRKTVKGVSMEILKKGD